MSLWIEASIEPTQDFLHWEEEEWKEDRKRKSELKEIWVRLRLKTMPTEVKDCIRP